MSRSYATFLAVLLHTMTAFAQEDKELRPVTRTYALTNATIIQAPGKKIERGTLVIKDGLVLSVGTSSSIPADALIIKADSLFIYAGFIDGLSHTGVNRPKEEPIRERPREPGNPTYERAGIVPQTDVVPLLASNEKSIEEMRSVGFTAAQVVPFGAMLPGNAAIILLGGTAVPKMVLAGNSALYAELTPTQGAYPTTVIGVMAKFRELYIQATASHSYEALYASNRSGVERPMTNRVLQAFYPVIEKKQPILFKAEKQLDFYRIETLRRELGFQVMLGNLKDGGTIVNKIKTSAIPVFLSLDLPDEKKDGDTKDGEKKDHEKKDEIKKNANAADAPATAVKKDSVPKIKTPADLEKEALEKRKKESLAGYAGQASVFQKAGIHFGFSALTVKSKDVLPNLRKMIAAGLPEDEALAALTTYPATLLGVSDRLGTVEPGKIANLVITHKSWADEKAAVRYVFVDGELYKVEKPEGKKENAAGEKKGPGGSWTFLTDTPQGKSETKISFKKTGDTWTGTASGNEYLTQPTELKSIDLTGDRLKFNFAITVEGSVVDIAVDGKWDGDTFTGTSTAGSFGTFPTTGKKDPKF